MVLQILVLADGKIGDIKVAEGSGNQHLDDKAVQFFRDHGKFLPGTKNGKLIDAWKVFKVVFKSKKPE